MTSFTHSFPLYALAVADGPNSWVSMAGGGPFRWVHTPRGSCVGSGHSEEHGTPYTGGQVTNSRRGKSAHLINLCACARLPWQTLYLTLIYHFTDIWPIDETLTSFERHNWTNSRINGQGGGGNIVYLSLENENMATLQHNRERHLLISFRFFSLRLPLPPSLFCCLDPPCWIQRMKI